jgi:hypothetical protein
VTAPSETGGSAVEILYVKHEAKYRLESLLALLQNLRDLVAVVSGAVEDEYPSTQALAQIALTHSAPQQSAPDRARWWIASDLTLATFSYHDQLHLTFDQSTKLLALRPVWEAWVSGRTPLAADPESSYRQLRAAAVEVLRKHLRSSDQTHLLQATDRRNETLLLRAATALMAIDAVEWESWQSF